MSACVQPELFVGERFREWMKFHRDNPRVYDLFLRFTLKAYEAGERIGARAIAERIRWNRLIEAKRKRRYVYNDHLTPYYARLVMLRNEHLEGFFERRDAHFDVDDETLLREANRIDGSRN